MKLLAVILALGLCTPIYAQTTDENSPEREASRISSLARLYYKNRLRHQPEIAYFRGIETDRHDGIMDNSPRSINDFVSYQSWMLREVRGFNPELVRGRVEWITYVYMLEDLRARSRLKVCQTHLWNVNQMGGWHTMYPRLAEMQPVGNATLRQQALPPAFLALLS